MLMANARCFQATLRPHFATLFNSAALRGVHSRHSPSSRCSPLAGYSLTLGTDIVPVNAYINRRSPPQPRPEITAKSPLRQPGAQYPTPVRGDAYGSTGRWGETTRRREKMIVETAAGTSSTPPITA